MSPRFRGALAVCAALAVAGCSHGRLRPGAGEEGEVVEAEGWSPLDPQDALGTRQRALAEAQKKAVEKVVGVFISAKTRVDQAVHVDQRILANVQGYIRKYDVLGEKSEGGFLKTRIRALVLYQKVGADLKELGLVRPPPPPGNPRVVVALRGAGPDDAAAARAALGVRKGLLERGFSVADEESAGTESPADAAAAAALGRRLQADIVVTGEAAAYPIEDVRLAGFRSYRARVTLQAVKAAKGELLSQKSQEASGLDPAAAVAQGKALESAGTLAGEALAAELSNALKALTGVLVRLTNFKGLDRVQAVSEDLRGDPGVAAVTLAGYQDGTAELQVTTEDIAGPELAALLLRMKKFRFTAKTVTPYEVELEGD